MNSFHVKRPCLSLLSCAERCGPVIPLPTGDNFKLTFGHVDISSSLMSAALFKTCAVLMWQVGHIVSELNMRGELPETAEEVGLHPNVHRKLWRYVWLLDQVRSAPLM